MRVNILAGSKFWHNGAFEVKKETDTDNRTSSLEVNISSDLLGVSEVQVHIVNTGGFCCIVFIVVSTDVSMVVRVITDDDKNFW